jgi:hypothetical protein
MVLGATDGTNFISDPEIIDLEQTGDYDGILVYEATCKARVNGPHAYGLRVVPCVDPLDNIMHAGLVHWA